MLQLKFGEKTQPVREFVSEEQHEAMKIDLIFVIDAVVIDVVIVQFTVATDGRSVCPAVLGTRSRT